MHPDLKRGGWNSLHNDTASSIAILEKEGIAFALKAVETKQKKNVNTLYDSTDDDQFFDIDRYDPIEQKPGEYELTQIKEFLDALSVNIVFDCSFIKKWRRPTI